MLKKSGRARAKKLAPNRRADIARRVIGRTAATELLTGIKGGGALEKYLDVQALNPFINIGLVLERMIPFRIPEVEGLEKAVKGLPADLMIEICQGFVSALERRPIKLRPKPQQQETNQHANSHPKANANENSQSKSLWERLALNETGLLGHFWLDRLYRFLRRC